MAGGPALAVADLHVYYGHAHALQGVSLTLERGVLAVVGRNGMGKTTLCNTIMGLVPAAAGSVRSNGIELLGRPPTPSSTLGIGYVPQGRRVWPSLTVDEHLRLAARRAKGDWTVERIYETFPRLAERRHHGGAQLSGGEQQMLAISRALLANPRLLVMDEPTEGLAPVIVDQLSEMLRQLAAEGEISVLLIEQNLGVATTVASRVAIMVNGRIVREMSARDLANDHELQQRLLGVRHPRRRSGRTVRRWSSRPRPRPSSFRCAGRPKPTRAKCPAARRPCRWCRSPAPPIAGPRPIRWPLGARSRRR